MKTEECVFRYANIFSFIVNESADPAESSGSRMNYLSPGERNWT